MRQRADYQTLLNHVLTKDLTAIQVKALTAIDIKKITGVDADNYLESMKRCILEHLKQLTNASIKDNVENKIASLLTEFPDLSIQYIEQNGKRCVVIELETLADNLLRENL